jgi:hypothetical protein
MKRVAIIQPNYIPWKGYFDIIHAVDTFIFLDDVQYTTRDWRNRNKIKTAQGPMSWLTVPTLGGRNQRICDVKIDDAQRWRRDHIESLRHSYGRTPFFERYFPAFCETLNSGSPLLAQLDVALTKQISGWLGCNPQYVLASELNAAGSKDDRLIDLVQKVGGTAYLSGPAARDYIRPEAFERAQIELGYHDYSGYPEYRQISEPFDHFVTILDLLFSIGPDAPAYIWGERRRASA